MRSDATSQSQATQLCLRPLANHRATARSRSMSDDPSGQDQPEPTKTNRPQPYDEKRQQAKRAWQTAAHHTTTRRSVKNHQLTEQRTDMVVGVGKSLRKSDGRLTVRKGGDILAQEGAVRRGAQRRSLLPRQREPNQRRKWKDTNTVFQTSKRPKSCQIIVLQ